MSAGHELTTLLALKDRVPFTLRWMAYADSVRLPFRVFIADGGSDARAEEALSSRTAFPNVDYEYVRYPPDRTYYGDYWAKLADALSRIDTPFVALADNDDLFVVNGVKEAVRFLADHPDYAACGGQCAVFWVLHPVDGDEGPCYGERVQWKYSRDTRSQDDDTARARIRHLSLRATYPAYYHVRRTEQLRAHVAAVRQAGLRDVFLIERLLFFLTAVEGKTKQLDSLYIARQWNAPGSAGQAHEAEHGDWFGRLLVPTWSQDFATFVRVTSAALAERDGITMEEARRSIVELYRLWLAPHLLGDLVAEPTVTLPMSIGIRAVQRLLDRPPDSVLRRIARRVYRRAKWISVDAVHGTEWRTRQVPHAAEAFRPIAEFLAGGPEGHL